MAGWAEEKPIILRRGARSFNLATNKRKHPNLGWYPLLAEYGRWAQPEKEIIHRWPYVTIHFPFNRYHMGAPFRG